MVKHSGSSARRPTVSALRSLEAPGPEQLESSRLRDRALLLALSGPEQGAVFPLHSTAVRIGRARGRSGDVELSDDAVSNGHAKITLARGGAYVEDLSSKNGTFVNDRRVRGVHRLVDGDHVRVGNTILKFSFADELEERALTSLFELAVRDPLTQAYNRRLLSSHLENELAYAERRDLPLSLLLIDIDHFKRFNDTYGHRVGDVVLRAVAVNVQRTLRPYDFLCRFGGEEFLVVARGTSRRNAEILAERIRRRIEGMPLAIDDNEASVTVSVGVVTLNPGADSSDAERLLATADEALYRAKSSGRNRVMMSSAPPAESGSGPRHRPCTLPPSEGTDEASSDPNAFRFGCPPPARFA